MKKLNKIIKIIILVLIITFVIFAGYKYYINSQYPLHEITKLLLSAKLPDTFSLNSKSESDYGHTNIIEVYYKDNSYNKYESYINQSDSLSNSNTISIVKDHTHFYINEKDKDIYISTDYNLTSNETKEEFLYGNNIFLYMIQEHGIKLSDGEEFIKYNYIGKKTINNKECLVLELHLNYDDTNTYYYMDIETNLIIRIENYDNNNKLHYYTDYNYQFKEFDKPLIEEVNTKDYPEYNYHTN